MASDHSHPPIDRTDDQPASTASTADSNAPPPAEPHGQHGPKPHNSGTIIAVPPSAEAMASLTDSELHGLASAVTAEQHRRAGPDARRERTSAARRKRWAGLSESDRRSQTAAATEARKRKRRQ